MKKLFAVLAFVTFGFASAAVCSAQGMMDKDPMVGGAAMYPTKDIVDNAVNSKDHTTLVAAVKAAGLVETLKSAGPFTVFAPTNDAFSKLPAGTVDTLLKPENKDTLTKVLTYHVVAGRLSAQDLQKQIKAGHGTAELKTVSGGKLWIMANGKDGITIKDEKGGVSNVTIANVFQSNGVIHVVDTVLLPQ
jgi:uncharacterized surface protein with fasciclin (FAS1) repeats